MNADRYLKLLCLVKGGAASNLGGSQCFMVIKSRSEENHLVQ